MRKWGIPSMQQATGARRSPGPPAPRDVKTISARSASAPIPIAGDSLAAPAEKHFRTAATSPVEIVAPKTGV